MDQKELTQIVDGLVDNLDIMINHSPSCLKLISSKGELIMMNKTGLDLIESPDMESVLGADVYSIVEESHRDKFIEFNKLICSGKNGNLIFEIIGLKGTRRWMETYASPYILENGDAAHIAITNDITELKNKKDLDQVITEIREKFIEHNSNSRLAYEIILDKILNCLKCEFGYIFRVVNDNGLSYLKSYAISNIAWDNGTKEHYKAYQQTGLVFEKMDALYAQGIKSKKPFFSNDVKDNKIGIGLPDGHPEISSFFNYPLIHNGEVNAIIGLANREGGFNQQFLSFNQPLFQCINELVGHFETQQKNLENEKRLHEINQFLDLALEGSNIGIWEWNLLDNSVRYDKRYLDIIGFHIDEIQHDFAFWESRVHPDDHESSFETINNYLKGNADQFENPHRMKHADGHWVYLLAKGKFSAWDEDGKPTHISGTHMDVSKQKHQELELIEARNNALVAERSKTQFLANMSHEIRTPMNGVIGMLDLLKESSLDSEQQDMVNTIQYCGESLITILNDILDLSKIESGKLRLEKVEFDLLKLCKEVISIFEFDSMKKGVVLKLENRLSNNLFRGDANRIRQILTNFVSNAVKFTRVGNVDLIVSDIKASDLISNIEFAIQDTGIGISEDNQKNLFLDFMQADESTTREFGGTGLGLAISNRLIKLMKGTINVSSKLDQGSKFTINLPLLNGTNLSTPSLKVEDSFVDFSNTKILIVDDNLVNCKLVKAMLDKFNVTNDIVHNGLQAVERVGTSNPFGYTAILMDLQMPVMDGYQAATKIFNNCLVDCPQIVAITADVLENSRAKCKSIGMVDFLAKPYTLNALKQLLQRLYIDNITLK